MFYFKEFVHATWGLVSPKTGGPAGGLQTQAGVNAAVVRQRDKSFSFRKAQVLFSGSATDGQLLPT